ncbi:ABC transporter substrate-binding protein [Ignatzschineria sp. LJL83]
MKLSIMSRAVKRGLSALMIAGTLAVGSASAATLVYCSEASPETFNPQLGLAGTTFDASGVPLYSRLTEFKLGTTEYEPSLAESWEVSEDGTEYTFHLRKGVKFHSNRDFKPSRDLNADDIVFTFERQMNPEHPYHNVSNRQFEYFEGMGFNELIESVEKVDDHTVKITLTRADAPFLANLAMPFSSILSAEYADVLMEKGKPEQIDLVPIGTGPFQFRTYEQDSRILYTKFNDYFGEPAKLDRLVFSITPDAAVRYAKLQKGECHVMPFPNLADIERMNQDSDIKVQESTGLNIGYLAFNTEKKPLDQLDVRKALSLAINKADIIEAIFQGNAQAAKNFIPPTMWSYNDDIEDYQYNVEEAKALLDKAGVKDLEITLWAMPVQRPYNPNARRMAEMIQSDWAQIGVKANIVTYEWGEYLARTREGEHDTLLIGWTGDNGDPDNFYSFLLSCNGAKVGSNYSRWCNEDFDQLLLDARTTTDHDKRVELYRKAQEIHHQELPVLNIAHSTVYMPMRKEVVNYVIDPLGSHNFHQVDIEEK